MLSTTRSKTYPTWCVVLSNRSLPRLLCFLKQVNGTLVNPMIWSNVSKNNTKLVLFPLLLYDIHWNCTLPKSVSVINNFWQKYLKQVNILYIARKISVNNNSWQKAFLKQFHLVHNLNWNHSTKLYHNMSFICRTLYLTYV